MQILDVNEFTAIRVETDENPWNQYTRYGYDCWYVSMGEADEPVYACEEIEALYQKYMTRWAG